MRTQEIHRLRQEQTKHLKELEEFDRTKTTLEKMKAKMEDLEAQLKKKCELERY